MLITRTYSAWRSMKTRCSNPNRPSAMYYLDKGITYDQSWKYFSNFLADMGECPEGLVIDRIDNSKGYNKENCRWVTKTESNRNSSAAKLSIRKVVLLRALMNSIDPKIAHRTTYVQNVIGSVFGVSRGTVRRALWGEHWNNSGEGS